MILLPAITRGMLRRADDPMGIYFQLRVGRPARVPQKITDPRPPIWQEDAMVVLRQPRVHSAQDLRSFFLDFTLVGTISHNCGRRQDLFCRVDEATFADVVFDRREVTQ